MTQFQFPPRSTRGSVLGFTWGQIILCATGVICLVIALRLGGDSPWAAGGVVALAVALFVLGLMRLRGRRITEWLPILIGALIQRGARQDRYRGAILAANAVAEHMDLPGPLAGYQWLPATLPDGRTAVGLLAHRPDKTITAVLACHGENFVLADTTVQEQRLTDWTAVLDTLGSEYAGRGLLRWALTARAVPDTGNRAQRYLVNRAVDQTSTAYQSLAALTAAAAPAARRHEMFLSVVFDRARLSKAIGEAGGTDAAAAAVVLEQLAGIEASVNEAGVATGGWLGPRQLAAVLRTQFDPDDQAAVDLRGSDGTAGGVDPRMAGPTATEVTWSMLRHDSAVSQTLWVYEMPRQRVGPTWLTPLFTQTACRRTITLVAEPVPAALANLAVRRDKVARAGDAHTKRKLRLVRTAHEDAEALAVEQIDREQAAGHVRYRYAMLVTITAADEAQLARDVLAVKRKLWRARCEAVVLYGEQDQAFYAGALPLARGIKPLRGWLA